MLSSHLFAALWAAFTLLGSALSLPQDDLDLGLRPIPPCPTCYTSTIWLPPPCAPPPTSCTGPFTPPRVGCTSTIDLRPITFTIPGPNPACPSTPSVISALPCPTIPACYAHKCSTVILGPEATDGVARTTVTKGPMRCRATGTKTAATRTTMTMTTTRGMWDATLTTRTPPPRHTLPPPPPPDQKDE